MTYKARESNKARAEKVSFFQKIKKIMHCSLEGKLRGWNIWDLFMSFFLGGALLLARPSEIFGTKEPFYFVRRPGGY